MATRYSLQICSFLLIFISIAQCVDDTRTLQGGNESRHSRSESFKVQIRAAATPTFDLSSMSTYIPEECSFDHVELDCSPVSVSCPTDASSGATDCITYPLDCYCALPIPLACAFWATSWWDWQHVEDWFTGICPAVMPIDFTGLPSCGRDCVADSSFDWGCITASQNCFCSTNSLFGCDLNCKQEDVDEMVNWFTEQCQAPEEWAIDALNDTAVEKSSGDAPLPSIKGRPLRWYEIMAIIVAGTTFVGIGAVLILPGVLVPQAKQD